MIFDRKMEIAIHDSRSYFITLIRTAARFVRSDHYIDSIAR